ncbi:zinc finger protein 385B-like isoform X2 [Lineus longissimus]
MYDNGYYENYENHDSNGYYDDGYDQGYNENYNRPPARGRPGPPPPPPPPPPGMNRPPPPQRPSYPTRQGPKPRDQRQPNFQKRPMNGNVGGRFSENGAVNGRPGQGLKRKYPDLPPPPPPPAKYIKLNGVHNKFNQNNNTIFKNNNLKPNHFALREKNQKLNNISKKPLAKVQDMDTAPPFKHVLTEEEMDVPKELMQPLYCKICSVSLNAPSQAQQHYTGKTHAKKVRQYLDKVKKGEMRRDGSLILEEERNMSPVPVAPPEIPVPPIAKAETCVKIEPPSVATQINGSPTTVSTPSPTSSTSEPAEEVYCKVCDVSFNSTKQAQQHYQGKNHARRVKIAEYNSEAVKVEPAVGGKKATYMCTVCQVYATSQEQLNSHLRGAKHAARLNLKEKGSFKAAAFVRPLKGRWGTKMNGNGGLTKFIPGGTLTLRGTKHTHNTIPNPHNNNNNTTQVNNNNQVTVDADPSFSPPAAKKIRRDFTNYRTPSGQFYCSACNISANSDTQFQQHIESKKHRVNHSAAKKTNFVMKEDEES